MSNNIIVYRSAMEKNVDEFWSSQEGLEIIGHGIEFAVFVVALFCLCLAYNRVASHFGIPTLPQMWRRLTRRK